jgi:hypothetical protein
MSESAGEGDYSGPGVPDQLMELRRELQGELEDLESSQLQDPIEEGKIESIQRVLELVESTLQLMGQEGGQPDLEGGGEVRAPTKLQHPPRMHTWGLC